MVKRQLLKLLILLAQNDENKIKLVEEGVLEPLSAHIDLEQFEVDDIILAMRCLMEVLLGRRSRAAVT